MKLQQATIFDQKNNQDNKANSAHLVKNKNSTNFIELNLLSALEKVYLNDFILQNRILCNYNVKNNNKNAYLKTLKNEIAFKECKKENLISLIDSLINTYVS